MKLAAPRIPRRPSLRTARRCGVFTLSGALVAAAALALSGCSAGHSGDSLALAAANSSMEPSLVGSYQTVTLNNDRDLTFNQLLGINDKGYIAGYFGSGAAGHPNKGYVLVPPFAQRDFLNENFPGSAQTQVTGINDTGITVGFWANKAGANFGFYWRNGRFHNVNFPTRNNASPALNQLLGVNNSLDAVGFYNDKSGNAHGYVYNIRTGRFRLVTVPGATSLTAAAINNAGATAGFYVNAAGATVGYLQLRDSKTTTISFPGASSTQIFGVNDSDEVVGQYTTGSGNSAVTHGFVWLKGKFGTVNIPAGTGGTTVNGINDEGDLVGFYTDAAGNTDGFLALP
jgi:hypothetical protein